MSVCMWACQRSCWNPCWLHAVSAGVSMTVAGRRDLMLQLLISCLCALQPVVLVLLGERRRHQQRQQRQQQHGIPGEHHASWAENTTGASRHFAFLFLISVFLFRLFLSRGVSFFFFFFSHLLLLFFTQSLTRKDTTASIHGRAARIEHPLYRRTTVLLLPSFLLLSSSPLSCSVLTQRTSGPLLPPFRPETWIYGFTRSGFAGGGFCFWWVFSRTIWAPCWTARRPAAALKQRSIAISPTTAGFSLCSPCKTPGATGPALT